MRPDKSLILICFVISSAASRFVFIGLACVYLSILSLDNDNYENIIEWNFVFFIFLFFPVFYLSIKKSNV